MEDERIRKQQKEEERNTKNRPERWKNRGSGKGMQKANGEREIEAERDPGEEPMFYILGNASVNTSMWRCFLHVTFI